MLELITTRRAVCPLEVSCIYQSLLHRATLRVL
jgi:hypothetical protein